jgi:hypothetical protein
VLVFQRSNPRGKKMIWLPLHTLPPTTIGPSPSPVWGRPVQTPGTTRPQACLQASQTQGPGRSAGQERTLAAVRGRCGHWASRDLTAGLVIVMLSEATAPKAKTTVLLSPLGDFSKLAVLIALDSRLGPRDHLWFLRACKWTLGSQTHCPWNPVA